MNPNGHGLGLSISKEIATILKGDLSCFSILNEGSKFTFSFESFPIRSKQEMENKQKPRKSRKPKLHFDPFLSVILEDLEESSSAKEDSIEVVLEHVMAANQQFTNIGCILVADDQKINLELIKLNLSEVGITENVTYCSDGNIAVDVALRLY